MRERTRSLRASEIAVGDELPQYDLAVTSTVIVAGAIASRDFMPAHHDAEFAKSQGAPDLFMNILTT
jgi:acyl dehydratase